MTACQISTRTSPDQGTAVLSAVGELDLSCAAELKTRLLEITAPTEIVVVNLAECTFVDSTALGALVGARRALEAAGMRLLVINVVPAVWRVFVLTGLVDSLRVHQAPEPPALLDPFALAAAG